MAQRWPTIDESYQYYLRDRHGVIWFVDTQHGNGVATAVTSQGAISAGLSQVRDLRGPLHIIHTVSDTILDQLPTIQPKQNLLEAQQVILAVTEADAKKLDSC